MTVFLLLSGFSIKTECWNSLNLTVVFRKIHNFGFCKFAMKFLGFVSEEMTVTVIIMAFLLLNFLFSKVLIKFSVLGYENWSEQSGHTSLLYDALQRFNSSAGLLQWCHNQLTRQVNLLLVLSDITYVTWLEQQLFGGWGKIIAYEVHWSTML